MTLAALDLEFPSQLTADFWRYYGAGYRQLLEDGVPAVDVAAMAANLPRESATMRAALPPSEAEAWDVSAHLLAMAVDLLAGANWHRTGRRTGKPKPIKRPKAPTLATDAGHDTVDDFRAWYAAQPGGRPLGQSIA